MYFKIIKNILDTSLFDIMYFKFIKIILETSLFHILYFKFIKIILETSLFEPYHESLKNTTTPSQSWPGSNGNVGILDTFKTSKTGSSPSNAVFYHTEDISF